MGFFADSLRRFGLIPDIPTVDPDLKAQLLARGQENKVRELEGKPQVFRVGEGLEQESVLRPGPTKKLAALPKDAPVRFSQTEPEKIAPAARATKIVKRQIDIGKENEKKLFEPSEGGIREPAIDFLKLVAQAPQRAIASIGISSASAILKAIGKGDGAQEFKPETDFEKMVFGGTPIRGIFKQTDDAIDASLDLMKKVGVPDDVALGSSFAIAPLFVAGITGLDLTPFGGEKNVVKKISISKNADEILKLIKPMFKNKTDDELKLIAQDLTKEIDKNSIKDIILRRAADPPTKITGENIGSKINLLEGTEVGIVKQQFREDKLNLPIEQTKQINNRLEALGLDVRDVRTLNEVEQIALELGTDPKTLLKDTRRNLISDAEVKGLRNIINNNTNFVIDTQKQITDNPTMKTALREQLETQIARAERTTDIALKKLIKGGTEAGRAVSAFRMMGRQTLEPSFWLTKAEKEFGNELSGEMRQAVLDLIAKKDINGLANFVSMLRKPSFAEKGITLWKAGLLTAPTTHLANIGGNVTMQALMTASDVVGTGVDIVAALATGKRTTTISPRTISAKFKGLGKGVKESGTFLKTGIYPTELTKKWDLPTETTFKNKILDGYTKGIFRSLGAEDIVFRQAAMSEALAKQAEITAKNEGLKGDLFRERVRDLLVNPTNEMSVNAIEAAEFATFNNPNALANAISGFRGRLRADVKTKKQLGKSGLGEEAVLLGSEVVAPFTRTPSNIAARLMDYSPAGFIKTIVRQINPTTRGQKALVEDLSRAVTGTGIIAFGGMLAQKGMMTGNAPSSEAERADFFAEGKQPNSIKIGGKWFQLNRLSPFGNLLALGAEFEELEKEKQLSELPTALGFAALKGVTEQTFLKGVAGGAKAVTQPERNAQAFIDQTVASVIPTVISKIGRTEDPFLRLSEGTIESVQERLPIIRDRLPVRRDIFGRPVKTSGGNFVLVDPFSITEAKNEPAIQEAQSLGLTIGMPGQTQYGIKLTNEEYSKFQKVNGQILKPMLEALIATEGYENSNAEEKRVLFEKTKRKVRTEARKAILPNLFIERYDLPEGTNPKLLIEVLNRFAQVEAYIEAPEKKKVRLIQRMIEELDK